MYKFVSIVSLLCYLTLISAVKKAVLSRNSVYCAKPLPSLTSEIKQSSILAHKAGSQTRTTAAGLQQNQGQAFTEAGWGGQQIGSLNRQEQNHSKSSLSRPDTAAANSSKPPVVPVEWQPLQYPAVRDWMRPHRPQPGTR